MRELSRIAVAAWALVATAACAVVEPAVFEPAMLEPATSRERGERFWSHVDEDLDLTWRLSRDVQATLTNARGTSTARRFGVREYGLDLAWEIHAPNADGRAVAISDHSYLRLAFQPTAATWFADGDEQGLLVAGRTARGTAFVERIVLDPPSERMAFDIRGRRFVAGIVAAEPRAAARREFAPSTGLSIVRGLFPPLPGAPSGAFHAITLEGESTWRVHAVTDSGTTFVAETWRDIDTLYSELARTEVDGRPAYLLAASIEPFDVDGPRAIQFVDTDRDGLVDELRPQERSIGR